MKTMLLVLAALLFGEVAFASHRRMPQDLILPSQKMLEYEKIENAVTADDDRLLADHAGATAALPVTVSSFLAQPDVPRNIVVTPTGTINDVAAGNVVVNGSDARGNSISESFAFTANQSTAVTGTKLFAAVTSIVFPVEDSPFGATWDVGIGNKLGLKACLDSSAFVIKAFVGSTAETVTVTSSSTALESNGFTPTNAPDGNRDYEILYVQNFRCQSP